MSFFCLWIPQFPAWAVAQDDPHLGKRRFAVCEGGKIISASPLAEKHGVRIGMPTQAARLWCNGLSIIARNKVREADLWEEVQRAVHELTPRIEAIEPGLLVADVDATKMSLLVHELGAHGGYATDRATAHLAALVSEKHEIRCVRRGREANFVERVPLEFLLDAHLSQDSLQKLHSLGLRGVGDILELSRQEIKKLFPKETEMLTTFSGAAEQEANLRPVADWLPPQQISARESFPLPAVEANEWEEALNVLIGRVCRGLGTRSAQRLEIIAQTATNSVSTRRFLKEPVRRPYQVEEAARLALSEALESLRPLQPIVTGLEVRLSTFSSAPSENTDVTPLQLALRRTHTLVTFAGSLLGLGDAAETASLQKGINAQAQRGIASHVVASNVLQGDFSPSAALSLTKCGH